MKCNADIGFFAKPSRLDHNHTAGVNFARGQKEDILCQIETEPAQRTRSRNQGRNQDRDQDRDRERGAEKGMAPVVEKGLKAAGLAPGPVAAEAWAAARGQTSKTLRINKTPIAVKKETPLRVHRDSFGAGVKKGGTWKKF
jgi:hypothetical protein